jgi:hypothetical protein
VIFFGRVFHRLTPAEQVERAIRVYDDGTLRPRRCGAKALKVVLQQKLRREAEAPLAPPDEPTVEDVYIEPMSTTIIRRVSLRQRPTYASGGVHLGFIAFLLDGTEVRGGAEIRCPIAGREEFPRGDRKAHQVASVQAQRAAWEAARQWLRELGEVTVADDGIESSGELPPLKQSLP